MFKSGRRRVGYLALLLLFKIVRHLMLVYWLIRSISSSKYLGFVRTRQALITAARGSIAYLFCFCSVLQRLRRASRSACREIHFVISKARSSMSFSLTTSLKSCSALQSQVQMPDFILDPIYVVACWIARRIMCRIPRTSATG